MSYFLTKKFTDKLNLSRKIIPLIDHEDLGDVLKYIEFMIKNNFYIFEYTLRRNNSIKHLKEIRKTFPKIVLGAGSILEKKTISNLEKFNIDIYARPGSIKGINLKYKNYLPGVLTPTEILMFQKYDVLKLFPSNSIEIINYLKTINGPFPKIKFIPTGGVNIKNYKKILSLPNVIGVAGSFLFPLNSKNLIDFVKLNRILKNI